MVQEITKTLPENDDAPIGNHHHYDHPRPLGIVAGNYCHDVIFRDGHVTSSTLGGASSFISNVLSLIPHQTLYISKVGPDFLYHRHVTSHPPLTTTSSPTTLFHAHFYSHHHRRLLRRVSSCDPILPSDLPPASKSAPQFQFGIAAAVAGEIPPETLARLLGLCQTLFVDVQALIRHFDPTDGTVSHVALRSTPYYDLIPRIAFLKASTEEAEFVDVEEVTGMGCCVIVTEGKDGCRVCWKEGEVRVEPFEAEEVDVTGAGDSFLGGFVMGLVCGLGVMEAAVLGNFFGAITVGQVGVPKFGRKMLQTVKQELERKTIGSLRENIALDFMKSHAHEEFHAFLSEAAKLNCLDCSTELIHDDDDEQHM